jgi:nucleotide-binding universal stress UspA family protein
LFKRILYCTDGSASASAAGPTAGQIADKFAAALTVLHVVDLPSSSYSAQHWAGFRLSQDEAQRIADEARAQVLSAAKSALLDCRAAYEFRQETGNPAAVILRVAVEEGSDLIVLGSRGMGAVKGFMMGSVSDRVSHHPPCSVLIVR